jgi:hypothetical protein
LEGDTLQQLSSPAENQKTNDWGTVLNDLSAFKVAKAKSAARSTLKSRKGDPQNLELPCLRRSLRRGLDSSHQN